MTRDTVASARFNEDEIALIQTAADIAGVPFATFQREATLKEARRVARTLVCPECGRKG